jgi:hypothetical protein
MEGNIGHMVWLAIPSKDETWKNSNLKPQRD